MRSKGWVPTQHGAWAMLLLPLLLGTVLAARDDALSWAHLPLALCWILGYFAFHAASLWLKAAPRRRPSYLRALLTYTILTGLSGLALLLMTGPGPAWWLVVYLPLLLPALWLAWRRHERALIGGLLTVAAACLMLPVARTLDDPTPQDAPQIAALTGLVFGYFFGTVLFVKTNIRQRGSRPYLVASITWHCCLVIAALWLSRQGLVHWGFVILFAITALRSIIVVPLHVRPLTLGLLEIAICLGLLGVALS